MRKTVSFNMDVSLVAEIESFAEQEDRSRSRTLERILTDYFRVKSKSKKKVKEKKEVKQEDLIRFGKVVVITKAFYDQECIDKGSQFVNEFFEKMADYCESIGKTYKNYEATYRNWLKRDADKAKQGGGNTYKTRQEKNNEIFDRYINKEGKDDEGGDSETFETTFERVQN